MKTGSLWDDFVWKRAADGYEWQEVRDGLVMVPRQKDGKPLREVAYHPLSRPFAGMLNEVASLDHTPEAALQFANKYGQLGWPITANVFNGEAISRPIAPSLADYQRDPELPQPSAPGLQGEYFDHGRAAWSQCTWLAQLKRFAEFKRNHLLLREVPHLAPSLQLLVNLQLKESVNAHVSWSISRRAFQLRVWPLSLSGALWLQAAIALSLPISLKRCPVCDKPIELSRSGGARTDAMFCSDACKSKDLRDRKKLARALAKSLPPAQIAERLRSDEATVRRWLR